MKKITRVTLILILLVLATGCVQKSENVAKEAQSEETDARPAIAVEEKTEEPQGEIPLKEKVDDLEKIKIEEGKPTMEEPIVEDATKQEPKLLVWEKEPGIRVQEAVSSSTIFRDDKYWVYYTRNGIELAISNDGINFELKGTVIRDDGIGSEQEMVTNPAVFRLKNGKYRMIYEGSKDRQAVRKLYSAISDDGVKWTKEKGIRLEDSIFFSDPKKGKSSDVIFTSVPDVIRLENDCLRMYYTVIDESRIAESCDEGLTWEKKGKIMFDVYLDVVQDPDIIRMEDSTYKLFFSTQDLERTKQWVISASSEDGINFKLEPGKIESLGGKRAVDPDVVKLKEEGYRVYYGESKTWEDFNIMSAISIS